MTCLINFGYRFKLNENISPDGSMVLASTIAAHELERRDQKKHPHLENLYFDPQLYLSGLDPVQSDRVCAKLASYSWFGVDGLNEYDSGIQKQSGWMKNVVGKIASEWPQNPLDPKIDPKRVDEAVEECIEFQLRLGTKIIILPSPLTHDASSDYSDEIAWLDAGLRYLRNKKITVPVFATIALMDVCLRYSDPTSNPFIDMILDTVGAREIDGVYFVVEQSNESDFARQISNTRVLWSALHIVYILKHDLNLKVGVNFFGPFGLVLEAVGADFWSTGWYKSLFRLRLADKIDTGTARAYPSYWSYPAASDIDLDIDFDALAGMGIVTQKTKASADLIQAMGRGLSARAVPAWEYRPSNITAAREHFFESAIIAERIHSQFDGIERLNYVQNQWLNPALALCNTIKNSRGSKQKTKVDHVQAWLNALSTFRRAHNF